MSDKLSNTSSVLNEAWPDTAPALGRLANMETRIARSEDEISSAQKVRYQVFCEEYGAIIAEKDRGKHRERDGHDENCDHLIVESSSAEGKNQVVGTQRFLLRGPGKADVCFYSQSEFDVESLAQRMPDKTFMELGRSCILPDFRSKRTMELMWQGTWAYAVQNRVDVMIGCASFHASNTSEIIEAHQFLQLQASTPDEWRVPAIQTDLPRLKSESAESIPSRAQLRKLPPLIKGYLRLGAMFSDQVVADPAFGTIDVLVILPVERINPRYLNYYGEDASKHRA